MVILLPLLDGERVKVCKCGALGIGSPVRERSTFYRRGGPWGDGYRVECRRCTTVRTREGMARRRALDPEGESAKRRRYSANHRAQNLERVRQKGRESRARRKERDREAWTRKQREIQSRYIEKRRKDRERDRAARDRDRMNYRGRRERKGHEMRIEATRKSGGMHSGVRLPIGPFRRFVQDLIEEEVRRGEENPKKRVAARIDVDARRVHAYLFELSDVDEAVVDHAVSREGSRSLFDLYPEQLDYEPAQMELVA